MNTELLALPQLKDTPPVEQQEPFVKKLQQCSYMFDLMDKTSL